MTGRPPKPTALKRLSGNPGKRKLPDERAADLGEAEKPDWVAVDPRASKVWDKLAPRCITLGLLTGQTSETFGLLCRYHGELQHDLSALTGPQLAHYRALGNEFGLGPSALTKAGIATPQPGKKANPFALLSG